MSFDDELKKYTDVYMADRAIEAEEIEADDGVLVDELEKEIYEIDDEVNRYVNGKIYKLSSEIGGVFYIGSTGIGLSRRMAMHRCQHKRYGKGYDHYRTSNKVLEYPDAKIELIEDYPCASRKELEKREGEYIKNAGAECINHNVPGHTSDANYWKEANRRKYLKRQGINCPICFDTVLSYKYNRHVGSHTVDEVRYYKDLKFNAMIEYVDYMSKQLGWAGLDPLSSRAKSIAMTRY